MAKFYGAIGYGESVESVRGVWKDVITEHMHYGDVLRNSRMLKETRNPKQGQNINDDLSVGNSISIVADAYAAENFFAMRYIRWMGALWVVANVDVQFPRLILKLGGVYSGPTA